jgi:peptide methionine sulfoxide reductase MsrA
VQIVWHDMMLNYKKLYVDQFYYADVTKIIRLNDSSNSYHPGMFTKSYRKEGSVDKITNESNPTFIQQEKNLHCIYTIINYSNPETNKDTYASLDPGSPRHIDPVYIFAKALQRPLTYQPRAAFKLSISSFDLFRQSPTLNSQLLGEEIVEKQDDRSVS